MTTPRTARSLADALVDGMGSTVSPGCNAGLCDDDQGIGGRLGARGVPPLVRAGVAQGTALPLPVAGVRAGREYRREMMALRGGWRREFERYATLAMCLSRQVRL